METEVPNIDAYISGFPPETRLLLEQIRSTIHRAAPEAVEAMKYGMPTFVLEGNLVHFAGWKSHIGFYPVPSGIEAFKAELSIYKQSKGAVQFPLDQPMPLELISKIVKYRVQENQEQARLRKAKRKCKNGHTWFKSAELTSCPYC